MKYVERDYATPLSDPGVTHVGAHHATAGDTELASAMSQLPKIGTDRRRVLNYIASKGAMGATDEEVSLALSMRLYTAAPRRNELRNGGWVEDSGQRRPTTTGSQAVVWVLTEAAKARRNT